MNKALVTFSVVQAFAHHHLTVRGLWKETHVVETILNPNQIDLGLGTAAVVGT